MDIFVARQPIFDLRDQLFGYELLYRGSAEVSAASGATHEQMSSQVIVNAFVSIGIDRITDGSTGFINCTREMLVGGYVELLPKQGVVVEILESVEPDAEAVAACERLRVAGYTLALDDLEYRPQLDPLLELAQIAKIDVLNRGREEIAALVEPLRRFRLRLLAERVEDAEGLATCRELGFELFQGYHFSRPQTLTKREIPAEHLALLRLINLLRDEAVSDARIEDAFRGDPALSYKLLQIVNSASIGGRGIESIGHAIRLLGRAALGRWLGLLLITTLGRSSGPNRELAQSAILRARLGEILANAARQAGLSASVFMVGLFSRLDALIGMPMEDVLAGIDLAPAVKEALLKLEGPYAVWLRLVEAFEAGDFEAATQVGRRLGLEPDTVSGLYLDALEWTRTWLRDAGA